ncbi:MAG: hypothetical protein LUH05_00540 [Candidatus Gastranaerophilales bacterium]|nr:hypothetical protein [Candidatus Gastranaerophilales bacterium]
MQISRLNNVKSFSSQKTFSSENNNQKKQPSFKSIYVEDIFDYGHVADKEGQYEEFYRKDALLLNEIAQAYPNQDCFISNAANHYPCLAYREKPPQVQKFSVNLAKQYTTSLDPKDKDYPVQELILYKDNIGRELNKFFGVTSFISLNPSLPYTVKAGYELHKKLIEKKYQIMEIAGKNDAVSLGEESLNEKAHKAIEDIEIAVSRYLLESAFAALSDRASAEQIYQSNYPKVQTRLDAKRKLDLTTSPDKLAQIKEETDRKGKKYDICEMAMKTYPNVEENQKRINYLIKYMEENHMYLGY